MIFLFYPSSIQNKCHNLLNQTTIKEEEEEEEGNRKKNYNCLMKQS